MHFCGFSHIHSFIHSLLLSTWGVILLHKAVSILSGQEVKYVVKVLSVVHKNLQRSVASVEWTGIHKKNQYRVGHMGKVHTL